jgi:hypothetical protein
MVSAALLLFISLTGHRERARLKRRQPTALQLGLGKCAPPAYSPSSLKKLSRHRQLARREVENPRAQRIVSLRAVRRTRSTQMAQNKCEEAHWSLAKDRRVRRRRSDRGGLASGRLHEPVLPLLVTAASADTRRENRMPPPPPHPAGSKKPASVPDSAEKAVPSSPVLLRASSG